MHPTIFIFIDRKYVFWLAPSRYNEIDDEELRRSILFNAVEALRTPEGHPQALPVLHVTRIVADPRVEDIVQCMLPEEHVTDDPHASAYRRVRP